MHVASPAEVRGLPAEQVMQPGQHLLLLAQPQPVAGWQDPEALAPCLVLMRQPRLQLNPWEHSVGPAAQPPAAQRQGPGLRVLQLGEGQQALSCLLLWQRGQR